ncbi:MAG: NADH/ubiquinone/plastoquinone (complex I) [Candidatus Cloacimonetes bacterium]|nr:NADH/ubiquinone/plastoquinone (complex I) [Candidatus Cloacimonadota bacterium]MBT5421326.1 NADH/ubiquinone/plastoquinone (complex I) [Candidatus Cloacimonadota bacterium]
MNSLIPLFVIIPLGSAFIMSILGRVIKNFNKFITPIFMLSLVYLTLHFIFNSEGSLIYKVGGHQPVNGVPIAIYMVMDGLSKLVLLIISVVGFLSIFYSLSYTKQYTSERKFYVLFSLMIAGMNGIVISGDIFNIYVFLEIAAIASYALVAFGVEKQQLEASFKYQVLGGIASLIILLAIGLIYWNTGTLNIADISRQLTVNCTSPDGSNVFIKFISILLMAGFGLKAAIFPFHSWLPDAHSSAPSPISAMLSGVLIKAIGIYVIIRLFFNMLPLSYELSMTITILGTISMIVGVLLAIGQWDFKRLLAYHSISQMGYVIIGIGIGMLILATGGDRKIAALSISGGLFHMLNHSIFKGLLFLNAGSVEYRTGTRNLKKLGGLSSKMPITSGSSFVASMAISGIPPFNGFFSKVLIIIAAVQAGFIWIAFFAVLVSVITLASFTKIQKYVFSGELHSKYDKIKEVPFSMSFSMILLSILCVIFSLLIIPEVRMIFLQPAVDVLINSTNYATKIIGI